MFSAVRMQGSDHQKLSTRLHTKVPHENKIAEGPILNLSTYIYVKYLLQNENIPSLPVTDHIKIQH